MSHAAAVVDLGSRAVPRARAVSETASAFVDMSNIFHGLQDQADREAEWRTDVRLEAVPFRDLLRAGRTLARSVVVANADVPKATLDHFAAFADVITRESGRRTGTEQANDETLQVRIYETIFSMPAGVLVLATGDGAGSAVGRGFIPVLEAARSKHWAIEVLGWGRSTNMRLRDWLQRTGGVFVDLADYYYSISFIENCRRAQPISLRHRSTASR